MKLDQGKEDNKGTGIHGEFFQTEECNLSISLALSLVLKLQFSWRTKHNFDTAPTCNISWSTLALAEYLQMEAKILNPLSLATRETLRIFFDTMTTSAPWFNKSARPSAHPQSWSEAIKMSSQVLLSEAQRSSSMRTETAPRSTSLILFLPQGKSSTISYNAAFEACCKICFTQTALFWHWVIGQDQPPPFCKGIFENTCTKREDLREGNVLLSRSTVNLCWFTQMLSLKILLLWSLFYRLNHVNFEAKSVTNKAIKLRNKSIITVILVSYLTIWTALQPALFEILLALICFLTASTSTHLSAKA